MLVFVLNQHGGKIMPCKPSKARKLLKIKKAKIIDYKPFTIQLLYGASGYKQDVNIGVDLGAKYIGLAIQSQNKVIAKGEIELRTDIKKNIDKRRERRKSRRYKKRYRKKRFDNRKRIKGWLPPSLQSRLDSTFKWIDKFCDLLPNPRLTIEVGKFDVQKMINPDINGKDYQQGNGFGYYDIRYYVFARDNYTCQACKKKNKILRTHHIVYRSKGGSDRADNLITVCSDCHTSQNHKPGGVFWKWMNSNKKPRSYKETPFMNTIRKRVFIKYPNADIVYGSWTTPRRKELALEKTHYNDALVISGIDKNFKDNTGVFKIRQFRKKKRSLHESIPRKGIKSPNRISKRREKNTKFRKGLYINDQVFVFGKHGWITGFSKNVLYIKDIDGEYIIMPGKTHKQVNRKYIKFTNHNNNWQYLI